MLKSIKKIGGKNMNDLQVFRSSTTAEQEIVFEFPDNGIEFLIKNFTNSDIFVAGRQGTEKSDRILIPANSWQIITPFPYLYTNTISVIATETSEKGVEVQCLKC